MTETRRPTTGERLRDMFLEHGELNPWAAYRLLKDQGGFRGAYGSAGRLFYALRELGLIEFTREEQGRRALRPRRLYRIVPGREDDERWHDPHGELYPSSKLGALRYEVGTSKGRSKRYV